MMTKIGDLEKGDLLLQLEDCGHVFFLDSIDEYMFRTDTNTKDGHISIELKKCPSCRTPIRRSLRYGNLIKPQLANLERLKVKIHKMYNEEERRGVLREVFQALQGDLSRYNGSSQGHCFVCPNGHPYFIGECGGGNQISKCPDCGAPVGGTSHSLTTGNRFYSEVDGAAAPAWPTMLGEGQRRV